MLSLAKIQVELKNIEDNDIFWGDIIENFKDGEGNFITFNIMKLANAKEKEIMKEIK